MGGCVSSKQVSKNDGAEAGPTSSSAPIGDPYDCIEKVQRSLRRGDLECSQLIVGIDFTKSNTESGTKTFKGRSLHDISDGSNPYVDALSTVAKTLASFDDDNQIHCYGFGDQSTKAQSVFSFFSNDTPANGFEDAIARYRQIVPHVQLSGPTSFAPLIKQAMHVVVESRLEYHILVIIADGQVHRSHLEETKEAIVQASELPISIIMIGVGDGPWDKMKTFDDELPKRKFDNFQFVDFHEVMDQKKCCSECGAEKEEGDAAKKEEHFKLQALMEVPEQYKKVVELGLTDLKRLNRKVRKSNEETQLLLRPPPPVLAADTAAMSHNCPPQHA